MVTVDLMTKLADFLYVKNTNYAEDFSRLYIIEVATLHGTHVSVISDRGVQLISQFWNAFKKCLGSKANLSTIFDPQTDVQGECTIKT